MGFDIRDHVDFNSSGRAFCPSCEYRKGRRPSQRSLAIVPGTDGAYLCHAGCSVEEIRAAIGVPKGSKKGFSASPARPARKRTEPLKKRPKIYTPAQVKGFSEVLLQDPGASAAAAREWLSRRRITDEIIRHYRLGLMGRPVGIGVPVPVNDASDLCFIKIRRAPWNPKEEKDWSQWGIPATTYFTHRPKKTQQTWVCEGEWDAILLGWQLHQAEIDTIAVATFTCGCNSVPTKEQLERLLGEVIILYDLDEAGREGALKLAPALAQFDRSVRIGQVPAPEVPPKGWDISDALNQGFSIADISLAVDHAVSLSQEETPMTAEIPEFDQVMKRVEAILDIENPGRRLWEMGCFSKITPFNAANLQRIFEASREGSKPFGPVDVQDLIDEEQPERQWVVGSHISKGTVVLLYANGGAGKTLLIYDITKAVALGIPWNNFPVSQGRVLIIQTDEPEIDTRERLRIAQFQQVGRERVFVERNWQFNQTRQLCQWIEAYQPLLVVIDSLTSTNRFSDLEEKDMGYARGLLELAHVASNHNCSFLILHHENKLGGVRGTTAIRNAVSEVWHLRLGEPKENLPPLQRVLEIEKSRSGCNSVSIIELDPESYSWYHRGEYGEGAEGVPPLSTRLLNHLCERRGTWFEPDELSYEFSGTNRDQIRKALERWRKQGVLEAEDRIKAAGQGSCRYKVYRAPALSPELESLQKQMSSASKTAPEEDQKALDTHSSPRPMSSAAKPSSDKDPKALDKWIRNESQNTGSSRRLQPGDICYYSGPPSSLGITCGNRDLKVLEVKGTVASVKAEKWFSAHEVEIRYLRKRA